MRGVRGIGAKSHPACWNRAFAGAAKWQRPVRACAPARNTGKVQQSNFIPISRTHKGYKPYKLRRSCAADGQSESCTRNRRARNHLHHLCQEAVVRHSPRPPKNLRPLANSSCCYEKIEIILHKYSSLLFFRRLKAIEAAIFLIFKLNAALSSA